MTTAPRRRLAPEPVTPAAQRAAPPAAGHNRPPGPMTPEQVTAGLRDNCADLMTRRTEILAGIDRFKAKYPTITDDDIAGRASDFAGRQGAIAKFLDQAEKRRVAEKDPHLQAERAVDEYFRTLAGVLVDGQKEIRARLTAYLDRKEQAERERLRVEAEKARQDAEEAERRALKTMRPKTLDAAALAAQEAEHAQRQAQATAAELSRVHSANGTVSSLRTAWKFDEAGSNLMELARAVVEGRAPIAYLAFNTTRINYAVRSERVRAIAGCAIREERSV